MPWDTSTRRQHLPKEWATIRVHILRRDPTCRACQLNASVDVDHITPGDNHDPANLQGLCVPCHKAKTAEEAVAAQPRRTRPAEPHPGMT